MQTTDTQLRTYIHSIPAFQRDGNFDNNLYQSALRNRGMQSNRFENAVRHEMAQNQLQQGIDSSYFVTESTLAEQIRLNQQTRDIRYLRIPATEFYDTAAVSKEEAKRYYQSHQTAYRVPEKVKLAYVRLNTEALSHLIKIDDIQLKAYFADHRNEFFVEEERQLSHILLTVEAENTSIQQQKALDLLSQLRAGANFAELAKQHSEDPGSASNGGDLGWVSQGVMVEPFEQAAFALEKTAISEPVKTEFGYHIIQVNDIRGGNDANFSELREQIAIRYRQQQAEELYYNYFERMANTAYENPDSLLPTAEILGLKIQETNWLQRNGKFTLNELNTPKILNAAFSEEVLQGNNSDLIEIAPVDAIVIRITEHEPASVLPFTEVEARVIEAVAQKVAIEKATELGKTYLQQLKNGGTLSDLSTHSNWELSATHEISRQTQEPVPLEIVQAAYSISPPKHGELAYTGISSSEGDYILIAVQKITDGDPTQLDDATKQAQQQTLKSIAVDGEYTRLREALRQRANIEIY